MKLSRRLNRKSKIESLKPPYISTALLISKMPATEHYNLTPSEELAMREKSREWKQQFNYQIELDDDNTCFFLHRPTQYEIKTHRAMAKHNSRLLRLRNRLSDKVAQRQATLKIEAGK